MAYDKACFVLGPQGVFGDSRLCHCRDRDKKASIADKLTLKIGYLDSLAGRASDYEKDFPETFHCRIEITDKSGRKYVEERKNNIGHPANPMSDNAIEEKFCKLTERVLTPKQTRATLDLMWHLEKLDKVSKIFDILVI